MAEIILRITAVVVDTTAEMVEMILRTMGAATDDDNLVYAVQIATIF